MIKSIILFLFLISCSPQDRLAAGAGVGGAAALGVLLGIKKTAEFDPYLQLQPVEVCFKSLEVKDHFNCVVTPCKKNCERLVPLKEAIEQVQNRDSLVIPIEEWSDFMQSVLTYCSQNEKYCKKTYTTYSGKVWIVGRSDTL